MISQKHKHTCCVIVLSIIIITIFVGLALTFLTPPLSKTDLMKTKILDAEINALPKEDELIK